MFIWASALFVIESKKKKKRINIWKHKGRGGLELFFFLSARVTEMWREILNHRFLQQFYNPSLSAGWAWFHSHVENKGQIITSYSASSKQPGDLPLLPCSHQGGEHLNGMVRMEGWDRGRTCRCPVLSSLFGRACCHGRYCVEALPDMIGITLLLLMMEKPGWSPTPFFVSLVHPSVIFLLTAAHYVFHALSHPVA